MKIKFKKQEYQTKAVGSIVDVFEGQPYLTNIHEIGNRKSDQLSFKQLHDEDYEIVFDLNHGYRNNRLVISKVQLLENINKIQSKNKIDELSNEISNELGFVDLDIEMETGTGKTYVYLKTILELNKVYGFTKFLVVVPSVAIREGVLNTLEITRDHFMEEYKKKINFFVYDSNNLSNISNFSESTDITVMVINSQAFNNDKTIMNREMDFFESRRPIDIIKGTKPIVILDEPQKLQGKKTKESLKMFAPLFTLNFSATFKERHNLIYVLDALAAFNQSLVKKIQVKSITLNNSFGNERYLYLEEIRVFPDKPPEAKIEFEVKKKDGLINKKTNWFSNGTNLFDKSNGLEQYHNFVIEEIDAGENRVSFTNGRTIYAGDLFTSKTTDDLKRIQIKETIKTHFDKEEILFENGIKTLSLFFIDEVSKYRLYDENNNSLLGAYGKVFEEEYQRVLEEKLNESISNDYRDYLKSIKIEDTHKGYFSIDKKTNRNINSSKENFDDPTTYELILKDKERLLSFEESTRFIFSHSALREGWDNPNVFNICTLKETKSEMQIHQEVGRGLRICVNKNGERIDAQYSGLDFSKINLLTMITNDSYEEFVRSLQEDLADSIYSNRTKFKIDSFIDKKINDNYYLNEDDSEELYIFLKQNNYLGSDKSLDYKKFQEDFVGDKLIGFPVKLAPFKIECSNLILKLSGLGITDFIKDGRDPKVNNKINEKVLEDSDFQKMWNILKQKYSFKVSFDTSELIKESIKEINDKLFVNIPSYSIIEGKQKDKVSFEDVQNDAIFNKNVRSQKPINYHNEIKYDLIGKIVEEVNLKRKTITEILIGISEDKFSLYQKNPEMFITGIGLLINEIKSKLIGENIVYEEIKDAFFDINIFNNTQSISFLNVEESNKHITRYVPIDGLNKKESVERLFTKDLNEHDDVKVFAKMPRQFYVPTPVGNYSPDWSIIFTKDSQIKNLYFVAETKGSNSSMDLREIERIKINCAKRIFNSNHNQIEYDVVKTYQDLISKART